MAVAIWAFVIHLTMIFDAIFSTISGGSQENVQLVIDLHIRSVAEDKIHREIRRICRRSIRYRIFCARKQDLILVRIIDLIQGFFVPDTVAD